MMFLCADWLGAHRERLLGSSWLLSACILLGHCGLTQQDASKCEDIEPPSDWHNPTCAAQLENTNHCAHRRAGIRVDGYCDRTCGLCQVASSGPTLSSGGLVFLLSAFSHDDTNQWSLIPHFIAHYSGYLGVRPDLFLLILHSDSKNTTGIQQMAWWLDQAYGVVHTFPVTDPYSSRLHFEIKVGILQKHVTGMDWVLQVDADEFVFFPGCKRHGIHEFLDEADAREINVVYGLMVDRIAPDGDVDLTPTVGPQSIFAQFPLNCAITLLLQSSDIRKATAYRGYLRTTTGNHNVIGINESGAEHGLTKHRSRLKPHLKVLRRYVGDEIYAKLPLVTEGVLAEVNTSLTFATVFHMKWIRGLAAKLNRRVHTEKYTNGQYADLRETLGQGNRFSDEDMRRFCNWWDVPSGPAEGLPRALTARELIQLFLVAKPIQIDELMASQDDPEVAAEYFLMTALNGGIAREGGIPVH